MCVAAAAAKRKEDNEENRTTECLLYKLYEVKYTFGVIYYPENIKRPYVDFILLEMFAVTILENGKILEILESQVLDV